MTNAPDVFIVREHRGTIVCADLLEDMLGEVLIAHDLLVAKFVECLLRTVEILLELLLRRGSTAFK